MKQILLACLLLIGLNASSQLTYYWVGSSPASANTNINAAANWNTILNGTGATRSSSTNAADILIFDGSNLGGTTPITGAVNINANSSITCAVMKFVNGADVSMGRTTTMGAGTTTISLNGDGTNDPDFIIDAGCTVTITSGNGSMRFSPVAGVTTISGRISGNFRMITNQQARFDNLTNGTGKLVFTSGSSFTSNITSASSYAFGNVTQSAEKWVVFETGSHLYYEGGNSPMASSAFYSPIDFKAGSTWHHRSNNGAGTFMNRKSFADIIVENNAAMTVDGPVYRIDNLTVTTGSSFMTNSNGQTAVLGNIIIDGTMSSPAAATHELLIAGNTPQTISGSGSMNIASLLVASNAALTLNKNIGIDNTTTVYGKLNFNTNRLTGNSTFTAYAAFAVLNATGNLNAGSYFIPGTGIPTSQKGLLITGSGIAPNTAIVGFSFTGDSVLLSAPITTSGTAVPLTISGSAATLQTANTNGFNPASGSVGLLGTQTFANGVNYVINAATTWPLGVTTASTATPIIASFIEINAPVTLNRSFSVSNHLTVNNKLTLRPLDAVHLLAGAALNGTFNTTNYIVTDHNSGTGEASVFQYDGISATTLFPVGTVTNYLPVTITPSTSSDFIVAVFEGITANGTITGTPLSATQKQSVVNAVWNINRLSGSGNADMQLAWATALEGSTFTSLPNTDIGLIANTGSSWALPVGTGDNVANTVTATINNFGSFSAGAVPPSIPFVFNPLPVKVYGDINFNGGASSLNTTQPIVYTSSNTAVATIVNGDIHITGAGTSDITASQASDGFYPAASATQTLTVNPASLTIKADNKTKFEGQVNPTLTVTYSGFVLSETAAVLLTQPTITTTAVTASPPGVYPITGSGATSVNYTISFVNGTLTVQAKQNQTITFNALPVKNYGNADFAAGATSTNNTIPITYASNNTSVATISGTNIHIVGAGTATITASQAGNVGYFPAADVSRTLTVNKVNLTIRVRDTLRLEGEDNPPFTITYTGFVLGETAANLLTPVVATTAATNISAAGYYPITLGGATSGNYNIIYTNGRLTVLPPGGAADQHLNVFAPNSSTLTVRVYSPVPALGDITLYDFGGRPLMKKNLFMPVGFINTDMPIPTLPSGIYIVTVKGNGVDLKKTISVIK